MKFKSILFALAASASLATNVGATYISGTSLQGVLDNVTDGGLSSVNVQDDQYQADEVWSMTASGGSISRLIIELAGFADYNAFGVYDTYDSSNTIELFSGSNSAGDVAVLLDVGGGAMTSIINGDSGVFSSRLFGFYLDTPGNTYYSQDRLNSDSADQMVAFQGTGSNFLILPGTSSARRWTPNEFIVAWEDLAGQGDRDYNDFVVLIESVIGVPEPTSLALFGIVLFGFGLARWSKTRSAGERNLNT